MKRIILIKNVKYFSYLFVVRVFLKNLTAIERQIPYALPTKGQCENIIVITVA